MIKEQKERKFLGYLSNLKPGGPPCGFLPQPRVVEAYLHDAAEGHQLTDAANWNPDSIGQCLWEATKPQTGAAGTETLLRGRETIRISGQADMANELKATKWFW
jgi:hypothetical protein